MKEELHLRRLYQRLYVLLEEKKNIGEFILPIFKEINYLSHDQFREMNERLKRFEEQPEIVRKKIKGDYLVDHEKYINAIQVYQETLKDTEENETNMGSQFTGSIYNNMGCAYASLFQMNEALTCFQKANEELHTKASLKSWLFAVYMSKGQDAYEQMCTERKVDAETKREMDRQITEAMQVWTKLLRRGHGNIIKIPDFEQKEQKNYLTAKKNGTIIQRIRKK